MKNRIKKWIKRPVKAAFCTARALAWRFAPVWWESWFVQRGYRCWQEICSRYGEDVHIFFLRGATGDVYLTNLLLPAYLAQHRIARYVLVGDAKGLKVVSDLFGQKHIEPISRWKASALQCFYKLCGPEVTHMTDLFMWQHTLYFNRCRIRMEERFNFMDTYQYYVFGFREAQPLCLPHFCESTEKMRREWEAQGIVPGKTVVIAPYAYSVTPLPDEIWQKIADGLNALGYRVIFCVEPGKEKNPAPNYPSIFFPYAQSVPLLEYAGAFLGLRSGLCDIVSSAQCKLVILYPPPLEKKNYWEHRSDAAFCGLREMGLSNREEAITTPLLQNMEMKSDICNNGEGLRCALIEAVLRCFSHGAGKSSG